MIALGYVTILSFVIVLLLLTEFLLSRFLSKELCRKVIHIASFFTYPLALVFFSDAMIHFVIITGVFLLLVLGAYLFHWLKTIDGRKERHPGIVYYCFSIFALALVSYFYPKYSPYLGVSFIGLAFGDGIATIIGTYIPSYKIYKNKSFLGFISCMVAAFIGFVIFKYAYFNAFTWEQIILLAILTAIVELVDLGLDNLAIPVVLFLTMILWQYVDTLLIGLIIFESVFVIAFFSKFITYYGSLLASSIGMLYYLALGIFGISFIIGCYLILLLCSLVSKWMKNDLSSVVDKTKGKDFIEVLVNGFFPILGVLLYLIFKNPALYLMSLLSLCEGFTDSVASDIGTLSKKAPYDIFRRKKVEKGISGGMTILGTVSSLLVCILLSTVITVYFKLPLYDIAIFTCFIYLGSFADSLLGSTLQAQYKCTICGKNTEKKIHCNNETKLVKGISWINNDIVNLLSNGFVFILCLLLFLMEV